MTGRRPRAKHIEPLPDSLLAHPLEYILTDHLRQRALCDLCDQIADGDSLEAAIAEEVVTYLAEDLVTHVVDEEQDFFPLLRSRAKPEDEIEIALGQLSDEHANDERLATSILAGLRTALERPGQSLSDDLRDALRVFAQNLRQHLALENATIMPLATVRLREDDLAGLAARMAARRGIPLEEDGTVG